MFHTSRAVLLGVCVLLLASCSSSDPKKEEAAMRELAARYERAWNSHQMTDLGNILTGDADWIGMQGLHFVGRGNIVQNHVTGHLDAFKDSRWSNRLVQPHLLRPDVGLVYTSWVLTGARDRAGTLRGSQSGVMSWVVIKEKGEWKVRAAQSTAISLAR